MAFILRNQNSPVLPDTGSGVRVKMFHRRKVFEMRRSYPWLAIMLMLVVCAAAHAAYPDPPSLPPTPPLPQLPPIGGNPGTPTAPDNPGSPPTPNHPSPQPPPGAPTTPGYPGHPQPPQYPGYESAESLYRNGMEAASRGDYRRAIYNFRRLLERYPYDFRAPEAAFQAAECSCKTGEFDRAIEYYRRVVTSYPRSARCEESMFLIGRCMSTLGEHRNALDQFIAFIRKYPNGRLTDDAWFFLGQSYERLNDPADAITCYRELINRFPGSDYYSQARARLRELEQVGYPPTYPPTYPPGNGYPSSTDRELYDMGHTALLNRDYNGARSRFDELLRRYPDSAWADDALLWTGKSYAEERNWKAASKAFSDLLFRYADSELRPDAHYSYAWSLYQQAIAETGRRLFEQAATEFSSFGYTFSTHSWAPEAVYLAGDCYDRIGNTTTARRYFQETINRYPGSTAAQKARERLEGTF